jgi:hypothetical protein
MAPDGRRGDYQFRRRPVPPRIAYPPVVADTTPEPEPEPEPAPSPPGITVSAAQFGASGAWTGSFSALEVPSPALVGGFDYNMFFDDFDSAATTDTGYTFAEGFNWYPWGSWYYAPRVIPADMVFSGGAVTLSGSFADNEYRPRLSTSGLAGYTAGEKFSSQTNLLTSPWVEVQDSSAQSAGTVLTSLGGASGPGGSGTAYRMALSSGGGWGGLLQRITTPTPNGPWCGSQSIWARSSASGGASNLIFTTNNTTGFSTGSTIKFPLTSDWQNLTKVMAFSNAFNSQVNQQNCDVIFGNVGLSGTADASANGNVDIYLPSVLTTNPLVVGTTFQPTGGYFEVTFSFDPTDAQDNSYGWPSFWLQPIVGARAQFEQTVLAWAEMDIFEMFDDGAGVTDMSFNNTHHTQTAGSGTMGGFTQPSGLNIVDPAAIGNPTMTNLNKWGCLWLTMAQNGGTGLFRFYFNRVAYPAFDITYTASDDWASIEDLPLMIHIEGAPAWPTVFSNVQVWQ